MDVFFKKIVKYEVQNGHQSTAVSNGDANIIYWEHLDLIVRNLLRTPETTPSSLVQLSSLRGSVLNTSVQPFFSFAICSRGSVMGGVSLALICRISQLNASVDYTWQQPDTDKWLS